MYDIDLKNDIAPNSDFDLRINVGNIGTGNARNIKISPDYEGIGPVGRNIVLVDRLLAGNNSEVTNTNLFETPAKAGIKKGFTKT